MQDMAHACNYSKQDVTAGRSEVQVILWVVLDCVKRVVWTSHEEQVSKQHASMAFVNSFLQVLVPSSCPDLPGWWTASCHGIKSLPSCLWSGCFTTAIESQVRNWCHIKGYCSDTPTLRFWEDCGGLWTLVWKSCWVLRAQWAVLWVLGR